MMMWRLTPSIGKSGSDRPNFFQPERMAEQLQLDPRAEPQVARSLGDSRQKDPRGRRIAERGVVVLGEMVAVEPRALLSLDQLEPLLELPAKRQTAVVQVVKHPK